MWNVGEAFKYGKELVIRLSLLMEDLAVRVQLFKRNPAPRFVLL